MALEDRIMLLNDYDAVRFLVSFSAAHAIPTLTTSLDFDLARTLRKAVDITEEKIAKVSEGELARTALLIIADDPAHRRAIGMLIDGPLPEQFGLIGTAVVFSAALVALQTHFTFERDKEGKWSVKIEKKPTDTKLLKDLVQKILSWL